MASESEIKDLWERIRANFSELDVKVIFPGGGLARGELSTICAPTIKPCDHWPGDLVLSLERSEVPSHLIREVKVLKRRGSKSTEVMSEVRRDIAFRQGQRSLNQALENFGNPFKES